MQQIPAACSLCKYTWEVVTYLILTGKGRPGPDIWPETPDQAESIEINMKQGDASAIQSKWD